MRYRAMAKGREQGALGVFTDVWGFVQALTEEEAREKGFQRLHEQGYELLGVTEVLKLPEESHG